MRTVQVASILAMGLVLTSLIVAMPANANTCVSAVSTPTACATAIYNNEKKIALETADNAMPLASGALASAQQQASGATNAASAKAAAAQAWEQLAAAHVSGCGLALPALPINWNPQPAIDNNLNYLNSQQQALSNFAGPATTEQPFYALGTTTNTLYFNTVGVFAAWQEHVFDPLIVAPLVGLTDSNGATHTVSDLAAGAPGLLNSPGATAGAAAGCASSMPLPSL